MQTAQIPKKFYTKDLTLLNDRNLRIKRHFLLLDNMERCMMAAPDIAHQCLYVELDNGKNYLMDFSALYINCTLWLFNVTFGESITEEDVHDMSNVNKKVYTDIMNKIVSKFIRLGYDLDSFNILGTIKEKIIYISTFYGEIYSNTFSLYDIMAFESRSPEFSELFNKTLDANMSSSEIESYLSLANERFYEIVANDKKNTLYPFMSTGMVKQLQIEQMFVGVGSRQDIDKTILPVIIKRGWMHGMSSISEFFAEAVSTRNAIIIKKDAVPEAGHLSRKVNIACLNTHIDPKVYDCGTKHYLSFLIENESHLRLLEGKYMVTDPVGPILRDITVYDTNLIGTVVNIRSHTKCITGHKIGKVCSVCLGNKHFSLKDSRIGGLVSIKLINQITQLGMSSKHASSTNTGELGGEIFDKYFTISRSNIYTKKHVTGQLLIKLEEVNDILESEYSADESGHESGLDYSKSISMLLVVENGVLTGLDLEDKDFFINISDSLVSLIANKSNEIVRIDDFPDVITNIESRSDVDWESELYGDEYVSIELSELDESDSLFSIKPLTEEVSKHLKNTKAIIDGSKTPSYTKPEDMIMDLVGVLVRAKLPTDSMMIHIETLIMNLMRSSEDLMERPDFDSPVEPSVRFLKLAQAIHKSDLFSTLCFQDIKKQLELSDTLKKKKSGIFDTFFKNSEFVKNSVEFRKTRPYIFNS